MRITFLLVAVATLGVHDRVVLPLEALSQSTVTYYLIQCY
jgi:hypothetical protein